MIPSLDSKRESEGIKNFQMLPFAAVEGGADWFDAVIMYNLQYMHHAFHRTDVGKADRHVFRLHLPVTINSFPNIILLLNSPSSKYD
ncbi:hypothetical protein C4588_04055 [Candidatus Parcubacteria bacterium]|nr:MAG: hypothetical protein C4588_04055 [Candidatus Parcubacteria bacterium]